MAYFNGIPYSTPDEGIDFPRMAQDLVYNAATQLDVRDMHPTFSREEVYVVWSCYTLGNFKALCSTTVPDGRYYEVTYDARKKMAFVDTYRKTHNIAIAIETHHNHI